MREVLQETILPAHDRFYTGVNAAEAVALDLAASLLTQGTVESPALPPPETRSKEVLRERAQAMQTALIDRADVARARYLDGARISIDRERRVREIEEIDAAKGKGPTALQKASILNTESAWLPDIVDHMLHGRPITARLTTFAPESMVDGYGNQVVYYDGELQAPRASGRIGALLRAIHPVPEAVRPVVVIRDYLDAATGQRFAPRHQILARAVGLQLMHDLGAIHDGDRLGRDFSLQRTSELVGQVPAFIDRLAASHTGRIVLDEQGSLRFWPYSWAAAAFSSLLPPERARLVETEGICLMEDVDTPSATALEAASYLQETADQAMHLTVLDPADHHQLTDAFALLWSAGLLRRDAHHSLALKGAYSDDNLVEYAFNTQLQQEVKTFLEVLKTEDDVQALDPYKYIDHNYGKDVAHYEWGLHPDDVSIIKFLDKVLPKYLKPNRCLRGINIGRGPYSYLEQVLEPYLADVELADPAESAQQVMHDAKNHTLAAQYDVAPKVEAVLVSLGKQYKGSHARILKKATISGKGIRDMPAKTYDIVLESFVSCSRSRLKSSFWGDIRAKREALRNDDSLMVSLHMVKGQGWNYAGNFPSANLSLEQIVQGYVDAGMEILEIKEFSSDAKLHEGHSSMVAIVARPRRKHLALAA